MRLKGVAMNAMEILFDSFYLVFALSLGLRMFAMEGKDKNILAAMTFFLAFGDVFHLIPRILKAFGVMNLEAALSLGTKVSSLTMCLFYLLYYIHIKKSMDLKNKGLDVLVCLLGLARLVTIFMGFNNGSDQLDLISNLPFVLLGVVIVILLAKGKELFGKEYILVLISFACYIPVVLFKRTHPAVGALMIPKTIAYIFLIISFYKSLQHEEGALKDISVSALMAGLLAMAAKLCLI